MKKLFLMVLLLASIIQAQSSDLLLLMSGGINYNGTDLLTGTINNDFEIPAAAYVSDFSANANGWAEYISMTVAGNIDGIGGRDNTLRLTPSVATANSRADRQNTVTSASRYAISLDYYIPSANTCDALRAYLGNVTVFLGDLTATDTWTSFKTTGTAPNVPSADDDAMMIRVGSTVPAITDNFYINNISISQVSDFTTTGNHSFDSSSTYKQAGSYSGAIVASAAGNGTTNTISLASTKFTAVTNGLNYRFQVYAYTTTANTTLTFKLGDIVLTNIVPTTGMSVLNFDFKATASTTGNILLYLDKAATVYIDEVSLKSGS